MNIPRHDTMKRLRRAARQKRFAEIRERIRVIILARQGKTVGQISSILDRSFRYVQSWAARYRESGFNGLLDKPRSGRPKHLPSELEDAFIERVFQGPRPEDGVTIFTAKSLEKILSEEFNAKYSEGGLYSLMARLKLAWITSRPRHEKNDPAKMEAWKESFKAKSAELKKNSRTWKSRLGFKMNQDLDKKETFIAFGQKKGCDFR